MGKIREKVHFAKAYLFNPADRIWLDSDLPELAYSKEKWSLYGDTLEEALDIITKILPNQSIDVAWCFIPHHMIVFCDENGYIIGHVKICFQCSNYKVFPSKAVHTNNIEYFRKILDKLGVYIEGPDLDFFKNEKLENILFNGYKIDVPHNGKN